MRVQDGWDKKNKQEKSEGVMHRTELSDLWSLSLWKHRPIRRQELKFSVLIGCFLVRLDFDVKLVKIFMNTWKTNKNRAVREWKKQKCSGRLHIRPFQNTRTATRPRPEGSTLNPGPTSDCCTPLLGHLIWTGLLMRHVLQNKSSSETVQDTSRLCDLAV